MPVLYATRPPPFCTAPVRVRSENPAAGGTRVLAHEPAGRDTARRTAAEQSRIVPSLNAAKPPTSLRAASSVTSECDETIVPRFTATRPPPSPPCIPSSMKRPLA